MEAGIHLVGYHSSPKVLVVAADVAVVGDDVVVVVAADAAVVVDFRNYSPAFLVSLFEDQSSFHFPTIKHELLINARIGQGVFIILTLVEDEGYLKYVTDSRIKSSSISVIMFKTINLKPIRNLLLDEGANFMKTVRIIGIRAHN